MSRKVIFVILLCLPFSLFASVADSLLKVAERSDLASGWNNIAEYYSKSLRSFEEVALIRDYVEKAWTIANENNDYEQMGNAMYHLSMYSFLAEGPPGQISTIKRAIRYYKNSGNKRQIVNCCYETGATASTFDRYTPEIYETLKNGLEYCE